MKDKKGQVGLDTAKNVMLTIMVIGVIAFALILGVAAIRNTTVAQTSGSSTVSNETSFVNATIDTANRVGSVNDFGNFVVLQIRNVTGNVVIGSGNYTTTSNGTIVGTAVRTENYTRTVMDYTYTFNQFADIELNLTNGTQSFFNNTGTWFALLAVVIIILIIAIVIFAVNRFGGGTSAGL